MNKLFKALIMGLTFLLMTFAVSGATFAVNTTDDTADANPGDGICADASMMCSLRAAISEANALAGDDIITVPAGTYTQTLVSANEDNNAGGDWDIRSNIVINGAGAATTIIQAAASPGTATERVMEVVLTTLVVEINGVTLRYGNKTGTAATTTRGGGIRNQGTLTMNNCIVTENVAPGSAGIRNERNITLNNVTVSNNTCNPTAGSCFGGGMYNTLAILGTVIINNSQFVNNSATGTAANTFGFGAGLGIESASGFNLTITGSSFTGNTGTGTGTGGSNGSGIRLLANGPATANITNTTFAGNMGTGGASIQGQGITAFSSGTGTLGGTWDGITVNGNMGSTSAGGVLLSAAGGSTTLTIRNSTISNNPTAGSGGGIFVTNTGTATSTINIINSTVSGNNANANGGGVFVEQPGTGAVTVNFNFSTIANNRANNDDTGTDTGGGIFRSTAGTVNLKNTIVADNAVGTGGTAPDISGSVNSEDYNHIEDLTGATIGGTTTNNSTGDPMLGPLASNGGPTLTHLPNTGSVVVNAIANGTNDCGTAITTDQRAVARPVSGACEKGSVELVPAVPAYISGRVLSANGSPIPYAQVTLSGGGLPFAEGKQVSGGITARTNTFGYFRFNGILTGQTYTLSVQKKEFTFTPPSRMIFLTGNLDNENFTSNEPFSPRTFK